MKHLVLGGGGKIPVVPDPWLPATAAATEMVAEMTQRADLAVKIGPGLAEEAGTAQFNPHLALVEADSNRMLPGVRPEDVMLGDDLFRARHPLLLGALAHESAHARYSRWVPQYLMDTGIFTKQQIDVLVLLEESRIERLMRAYYPKCTPWLPAIVFELLAKDFTISDNAYGAAATAALILARVDAGTISKTAALPFRKAVLTVLDAPTLAELESLWQEYHRLAFVDGGDLHHDEMRSIARRWLTALDLDPDGDAGEDASGLGEGTEGEGADGDGGESGEGEGESKGKAKAKGKGKSLPEKVAEATDAASHEENMKNAEKIGDIKAARRRAERAADQMRHSRGVRAERAAYEQHKTPAEEEIGHGKGTDASQSTLTYRNPDPRERGAAAIFAKALSRVLVTDRRRVKTMSEVPGGRLKMRGALARSAQKATGQQPTALQWRHARTMLTDEPKLRVGLLTDISGSMRSAAQPMGSTAYIVGNAVERMGGLFASVVFGVGIYGVVRTHERINYVPVVDPRDGWENITEGFYALDYVLDLLDGDGVKILVLASDGRYGGAGQLPFGCTMMQLCEQRGVTVLHLDFTGHAALYAGTHNTRMGNKTPLIDVQGKSPKEVAEILGGALVTGVQNFYARNKGVA
jgi:hypothetical protein